METSAARESLELWPFGTMGRGCIIPLMAENKRVTVHVALTDDEYVMLRQIVPAEHTTVPKVLAELVRKYIADWLAGRTPSDESNTSR